jgi:hypothetical protein
MIRCDPPVGSDAVVVGHAFACPRREAERTSTLLAIFWHCEWTQISSKTASVRGPGNEPSTVLPQDLASNMGLAMPMRGHFDGILGGAASAASAIPAASLPTLLLGGLLLICP